MTAHSICVVKCGIGQSGPKSTWSYLGPIFSWLPYKERMVPHRLVGFPQFLLLSQVKKKEEYKIITLSFLSLECLSARILSTKKRLRFLNRNEENIFSLLKNHQQFVYTILKHGLFSFLGESRMWAYFPPYSPKQMSAIQCEDEVSSVLCFHQRTLLCTRLVDMDMVLKNNM